TAYALDREHELFQRFGSGEPAPVHDADEGERETSDEPAVPRLGRDAPRAAEQGRPGPQDAPSSGDASFADGDGDGPRRTRRRGRRRPSGANGAPAARDGGDGLPVPSPAPESLPAPSALSAGVAAGNGRRKKRGTP